MCLDPLSGLERRLFYLELLTRHGEQKYFKLSNSKEVDQFKIDQKEGPPLSFLKELGIVTYKETFKVWLRKFPRPILIFCVKDRFVIGWVFVEEWMSSAKDGEPIYVLRGIETSERMRKKKIGYRLLLLSAQETPGYLITKPINPGAKRFFLSNYFVDKEVFPRSPIDLQGHPGYLILPPFKKIKLLEDIEDYFD